LKQQMVLSARAGAAVEVDEVDTDEVDVVEVATHIGPSVPPLMRSSSSVDRRIMSGLGPGTSLITTLPKEERSGSGVGALRTHVRRMTILRLGCGFLGEPRHNSSIRMKCARPDIDCARGELSFSA
jgi:hypothetical protein